MKSKKIILIAVSIIFIVGTVFGIYITTRPNPIHTVTSDDATLELTFDKKTLPKGIKTKEISITRLDDFHGVQSYEFKPDGLTFSEAASVSITAPIDQEIPMFVHISDSEDLEFRPIYEMLIDHSSNEMIIKTDLEHFSNYRLVAGLVGVATLEDLGTKRVGEYVPVPFTVAWSKNPVKSRMGSEGTFVIYSQITGDPYISATWESGVVYDPYTIIDSPSGARPSSSPFTHKETFRCATKGDGFVKPSIYVAFDRKMWMEGDDPAEINSYYEGTIVTHFVKGSCELPGIANIAVEPICGGNVNITGATDKYHFETEEIEVFLDGPHSELPTIEKATYNFKNGEFSFERDLPPGDYEYGILVKLIGATVSFDIGEHGFFTIEACPEDQSATDAIGEDDTEHLIPGGESSNKASTDTNDTTSKSAMMLLYGGAYYPIEQFHQSSPDACEEIHWHADGPVTGLASEISAQTVSTSDPNPMSCGFGVVGQVPTPTITLNAEQQEALGF